MWCLNTDMASTYSDLDISFLPNPITKDLSTVVDEESIKQSVKLLVLTSTYERVFQPSVGGDVNKLLFEPLDKVTTAVLAQTIADVLRQFEPRIQVRYIDVYFDKKPTGEYIDPDTVWIEIAFTIINLPTLVTTGVLLRRLR